MPRPSSSPATRGPGPARRPSPSAHVGPQPARAGSRDEPGPPGAEAVGGRGFPSPGGRRPPLRLALLTPGGASRDPGEEDAEMEGRTEAAKTLQAHNHLHQTTTRRDTSPRALPLSARVISGCLEGWGYGWLRPATACPAPWAPDRTHSLRSPRKDVPDLEEPQRPPSPASSSCTSSFVGRKAGLLKTSFLWVFHWVKRKGEGALFLKCHP